MRVHDETEPRLPEADSRIEHRIHVKAGFAQLPRDARTLDLIAQHQRNDGRRVAGKSKPAASMLETKCR